MICSFIIYFTPQARQETRSADEYSVRRRKTKMISGLIRPGLSPSNRNICSCPKWLCDPTSSAHFVEVQTYGGLKAYILDKLQNFATLDVACAVPLVKQIKLTAILSDPSLTSYTTFLIPLFLLYQ